MGFFYDWHGNWHEHSKRKRHRQKLNDWHNDWHELHSIIASGTNIANANDTDKN